MVVVVAVAAPRARAVQKTMRTSTDLAVDAVGDNRTTPHPCKIHWTPTRTLGTPNRRTAGAATMVITTSRTRAQRVILMPPKKANQILKKLDRMPPPMLPRQQMW